jgi:hypothetical protein
VQAVLDLPVPANPGGELIGAGLVRPEVGDRVDGLGSPLAALAGPGGYRAGAAGDLDGLGGVRERDSRGLTLINFLILKPDGVVDLRVRRRGRLNLCTKSIS